MKTETDEKTFVKKFVFGEDVIIVNETLGSQSIDSHAFHIWPSSLVLACYMMKLLPPDAPKYHILELGCGCAIPGLLCAKRNCNVTLTDCPPSDEASWRLLMLEQSLQNQVLNTTNIVPLIWSQFNSTLLSLADTSSFDYILASDCFYDKNLFESLIVTVAYLLETSVGCKFLTTYHERVEDYNIQDLLDKWGLSATEIHLDDFISEELYSHIYSLQHGVNSQEKYWEACNSVHLLEIQIGTRENS